MDAIILHMTLCNNIYDENLLNDIYEKLFELYLEEYMAPNHFYNYKLI